MSFMPTAAELTENQFERISAFVKSISGINLHDGKKELVKARLGKRLRTLGIASFEDYFEMVRADASGNELTMMLDALSTNLTSFFRESKHFEFLAERLLPEVMRRKATDKKITIWSAGCSSGEEPYTIAIVLREAVDGKGAWDARILATDLSTKVLARAKAGVYDAQRVETVPPGLKNKYFTSEGRHSEKTYTVAPALRDIVTFARLNLMHPWPMKGPFDAIFCRNVMIYFDRETRPIVVNRFADLLAPGGVLFIGHSESLAGVEHGLEYVEPTVYRKP
jgi:chemotaxis protein methyltransferase CheR